MRTTNANQRLAREYAERHDSGYDARARELRAENQRRANAAKAVSRIGEAKPLAWLMRDVCSTPWAETRS